MQLNTDGGRDGVHPSARSMGRFGSFDSAGGLRQTAQAPAAAPSTFARADPYPIEQAWSASRLTVRAVQEDRDGRPCDSAAGIRLALSAFE
jgi:hypothetical protein